MRFVFIFFICLVLLSGCAKEAVKNLNEPKSSPALCDPASCNVKCQGFDFYYGGYCDGSVCNYKGVEKNSRNCGAPFVEVRVDNNKNKYDFYSRLVFCDYDKVFRKYTLFFEIKNTTDNIPKVGSDIWLRVPELDYSTYRTISREYTKGRVLWEESFYTYEGVRYRGQHWEIRGVDFNSPLDFELVYCNPTSEVKRSCDKESEILIFRGNTLDYCTG